ncbi:MAG TPA: response regulator [Kofleriaceae bacterium]|nr:response regulator [Kofleriaceae bacterium]
MAGVLIIDQSPALAHDVAAICGSVGLPVIGVARDGLDAVDQALRLRPSHLILDLLLPRLSGGQVLAALQRHGLAPMVVVVSAVTARESILAARQAGAHAYLLKPLVASKLVEVLTSRRSEAAVAAAAC